MESSRMGEKTMASTMTMKRPKRLWKRKMPLTIWVALGPPSKAPVERRSLSNNPTRAGAAPTGAIDRVAKCCRNRMPEAKQAIQKPTPV